MTTAADWHLRGVVTNFMDEHLRKMSTGSCQAEEKLRKSTFLDLISDYKTSSKLPNPVKNSTINNVILSTLKTEM